MLVAGGRIGRKDGGKILKNVNGRKEIGRIGLGKEERKGRKGGWNAARRNDGQRMKEENRSVEGNQVEWT